MQIIFTFWLRDPSPQFTTILLGQLFTPRPLDPPLSIIGFRRITTADAARTMRKLAFGRPMMSEFQLSGHFLCPSSRLRYTGIQIVIT